MNPGGKKHVMLRDAFKRSTTLAMVLAWFLMCGPTVRAQATGFTYQGQLTDAGSPAMGQYDLTFALFSAPAGGSQIDGDLVRHDVQVSSGVFSVDLDFGSSPFTSPTGTYLEIAVRAGASTGAFTALLPRKPITDSPYAVQTIRATSGAVAAAGDAPQDLSGTRTPARSGNDGQNITDERTTIDVGGGRGLLASIGRFPDSFAAPALPAGRRARERAALDFGLGTLRATERSGQGTPGEYRIHVITPFNLGLRVQTDAVGGDVASFGGNGNFRIDAPNIVGGRFAVKEGGNVGIGTDSPAEKLTVAGTVHSTSGGFKFPDGSVLTTAASTTYTTMSVGGIIAPPGGPFGSVRHLNLPTGLYQLSFTAEFANNANDFGQNNNRDVFCRFTGDSSGYDVSIPGFSTATFSIHSVLNVTSGGVDVECRSLSGSAATSNVIVGSGRLTAVRIAGSVIVQ